MVKKNNIGYIILLSILILLIIGLVIKFNHSQKILNKKSQSNNSKGLNNKISNLGANCYDINKPVTLNDQYTKNIACKTTPPPSVNGGMRVNYYNSE